MCAAFWMYLINWSRQESFTDYYEMISHLWRRLLWDGITSVEEIIMRWYHICGGDYYEMISHLWKRWASYIQIAGDKLVQSSPSKSIQKQFTALFKFCQLSSLLLILNMFQRRIRTLLNICREHFAKKVNNFLAVN